MWNYKPGPHNAFMNDGRFQPPWPRNTLMTPFGRADFQQSAPALPTACGVGGYGLSIRPSSNGLPEGAQNQVEAWQSSTIAPNMFQHGRKKRKQVSIMEDLDRKAKQIKIPGPFDYKIGGFVKSMHDTRRELQNQIRGAEVVEEASKRYDENFREKRGRDNGANKAVCCLCCRLAKRIRERSQIHFTSETILQEKQLKEMKEFLEGNRREKELLLHQQNSLKDLLLQQGEEWNRLTCTIHAQFVEQKNKAMVDQLLEKNKREKDELAEDHLVARSALMKEVGEAKQLADRLRHELEIRKTNEGTGSGHSPLTSTECIVCFHEMDNHGRMRALLSPCHHAGLCIPCAALCWNKNRKCPVCRIDLSQKPQAIPPIVYF